MNIKLLLKSLNDFKNSKVVIFGGSVNNFDRRDRKKKLGSIFDELSNLYFILNAQTEIMN